MASICILSTGQPSSNPRLVKEADALADAGHEVRVICAHWADWADREDATLLAGRRWRCRYVGGRAGRREGMRHAFTRLRHLLGRRGRELLGDSKRLRLMALSRVTPELIAAARRTPADLYIGHNLGALPAAVLGAEAHGTRAGFDAEDFHSGMQTGEGDDAMHELARRVEGDFLPRCRYVTAASPEIGEAYARSYGLPRPVTVLNVFPLGERPAPHRAPRNGTLRLFWFSQCIGAGRGIEDVVDAMARAPSLDVELHLQGAWQPGYEQRLRARAAAVGMPVQRIHHHPPAAPESLVGHAMRYDVGLSLEIPRTRNRDLCLTNKLFTYLLAGNAIVATRTLAQTRMAARLDGSMTLYEAGDAAALAHVISHLATRRDALEAARAAAWTCATREYNWDAERGKLVGAVQDALSDLGADG